MGGLQSVSLLLLRRRSKRSGRFLILLRTRTGDAGTSRQSGCCAMADHLRADVPGARRALRAVLLAPVRRRPAKRTDGHTVYAVDGETAAGALLRGERSLEMASPGGFEPPLPP